MEKTKSNQWDDEDDAPTDPKAAWEGDAERAWDSVFADAAHEGDELVVSFGPISVQPKEFNSMSIGPFTLRTKIQKGENIHDAYDRSIKALEQIADVSYKRTKVKFLEYWENRGK
jgi:hypothetical protein